MNAAFLALLVERFLACCLLTACAVALGSAFTFGILWILRRDPYESVLREMEDIDGR